MVIVSVEGQVDVQSSVFYVSPIQLGLSRSLRMYSSSNTSRKQYTHSKKQESVLRSNCENVWSNFMKFVKPNLKISKTVKHFQSQ